MEEHRDSVMETPRSLTLTRQRTGCEVSQHDQLTDR